MKKHTIDITSSKSDHNQNIDQSQNLSINRKSNYFSSFTTLLTSTIGVTILLMPKLFHQGGILFCSIQILIIGLLIYLSTSMLCAVAFATKSSSYHEVITNMSGKYKFLPNAFYLLLLCGNILVYHVFVIKNLVPMVNSLLKLNFIEGSFEWTLFAIGLILISHFSILPFIFSRKLRIVKKISNISSIAVMFSVVIIIIAFIDPKLFGLEHNQIEWRFVDYYKFDGLFICAGYYLLSFTFQQIVVEVSNEIHPKTAFSSDLIIFGNCMFSAFLYIIVSFAGYLSVYNGINLDSMNNYITYLIINLNNQNKWLYVTNFIVILNVSFANILNYIPTIKFLNSKFNSKELKLKRFEQSTSNIHTIDHSKNGIENICQYKLKNRMIVWFLFCFVLILTLLITIFDLKMDTIFNLVSAVGGPVVLIVMPSTFYFLALRRKIIISKSKSEYIVCGGVFILGLVLWGISIYSVFK